MAKIMWLHLLRLLFIMITGVGGALVHQYQYPCRWLHHYLTGKGGVVKIPYQFVSPLLDTLVDVADEYLCETEGDWDLCLQEGEFYKAPLHSSRWYEGSGFEGCPPLFYMIGCFTARVYRMEGAIKVYIKDVYDWHPAVVDSVTGEEYYYSSGFNLPSWIHRVVNLLLGEYYPMQGFPMGNPGISNKLWADLEKVGAKPFTSVLARTFEYEW